MRGLKGKVKMVLTQYPATRNSDIALTIQIWKMFYGIREEVELARLYDLPREDNVKRIRAKFCQKGFYWAYPTTLEVAKRRGIAEDMWREALGYPVLSEVKYPTREESYLSRITLSDATAKELETKQDKLKI